MDLLGFRDYISIETCIELDKEVRKHVASFAKQKLGSSPISIMSDIGPSEDMDERSPLIHIASKVKQQCEIPNIVCQVCTGKLKGYRSYFNNKTLEIGICVNKIESREELIEALTHEFVHAYDKCVWNCRFTDALQLACSEIRAAKYAECAPDDMKKSAELLTNNVEKMNEDKYEEYRKCVERKAERSARLNIENSKQNVQYLMKHCFDDHQGFFIHNNPIGTPFPDIHFASEKKKQ